VSALSGTNRGCASRRYRPEDTRFLVSIFNATVPTDRFWPTNIDFFIQLLPVLPCQRIKCDTTGYDPTLLSLLQLTALVHQIVLTT